MSALGELLELLYTARDRFSTVEAELLNWRHVGPADRALERWAAGKPPGSVSVLRAVDDGGAVPSAPQPAIIEHTSRIWYRKPSHWRYEGHQHGVGKPSLQIIDGGRWWAYHHGGVAQTNVRSDQTLSSEHRSVDEQLESFPSLDPSGLIPGLSLEPLDRVVHRGREAIHARALPRGGADPDLWPGGDQYELLVDAERGVLLRITGQMDGDELGGMELTSVAFDEELPDERFTFDPPPGVRLQVVEPGVGPRYGPRPRWWRRWLWRRGGRG